MTYKAEWLLYCCSGAPREGRDTVGEDWVMTDLSGADAPAPTGGAPAWPSMQTFPWRSLEDSQLAKSRVGHAAVHV